MIRRILFLFCLCFCTLSYAQSTGMDIKGNDPNVIQSQSSTSISIFPNPATHYFKVTDNDNIQLLVVTDLLGKKVKEYHYAPEKQYDVQDLRKGMYLVQIISKEQQVIKIQRLIKNQP